MHANFGSPVAPPGVSGPLWLVIAIAHVLLWVSAIVHAALCVDLAWKQDAFKAIALTTLISSGVTVLLAVIAALVSMDAKSTANGIFGYLSALAAATATGAYILLVVDVSDMRSTQLGHSMSAAGTVTGDELFQAQAGLLSAFIATFILVRHEMAALAHKAAGPMGSALVLTAM